MNEDGLRPFTVFLISPANLGGQRAKLVFNPKADFDDLDYQKPYTVVLTKFGSLLTKLATIAYVPASMGTVVEPS